MSCRFNGNPGLCPGFQATVSGLDVIIVTAQKRAQDLQDVPIAVTALNTEALQSNRVVNVTDLSGLAPGVTVRTSAGGSKLPSFSVRGAVSYGVAPGSDKQVSIYLDGVYISSPRGSIFDLPDVERIEMLRGPQGTLFGRNATAGAVSISTRDPDGEAGVKSGVTVGNHNQRRFQLSADTPQFGPFSAYFSYVHDERRGDTRNLAAGQVWDRTSSLLPATAKIQKSPEWLGSKNADSYFAALKFESGDFKTTYKFDYSNDDGTPEASGLVALNTAQLGALFGGFIQTMIDTQAYPVDVFADAQRPDAVPNGYAVPTIQKTQGHSLTSTLQVDDNISIKNIAAYRKSFVFATSALDGISSLTVTPESIGPLATLTAYSTVPGFATLPAQQQQAIIGQISQSMSPLVGAPYIGIATSPASSSKQYSDELQVNYDSDFLTATVGGLWFHSKDYIGHPFQENTVAFQLTPGGVFGNTDIGQNFNKATSLAAYAQLEFHVADNLDVILGGRITKDKKSGSFTFGPTLDDLTTVPFVYKKTKPNYLIGVNYKPTDDILLYAKHSTAFVSGGSVATIDFDPEEATSFEAGVKAEFFDRKLRTSLALYHVKYKNYQSAQGSTGFEEFILEQTGDPAIAEGVGTFVVDSGNVKARGFEFDFDAAPVKGVTLGGSLGYTKTTFSDVNPGLIEANKGQYLPSSYRPEWTGSVYAQYQSEPLFDDAYLTMRADAIWQSDMGLAQNPDRTLYQLYPATIEQPSYWLINGRVALRDVDLGGVKTTIAAWGKNLTNESAIGFLLNLSDIFGGANFIPERSYGLDLTVEF